MQSRILLLPRAQLDMDDVWSYTTLHWGIKQAEFYTRQLWQQMQIIAANPAMGRSCSHIRKDYYSYPVASHVISFRVIEGGIDVVRILHKQMYVEQQLDL